MRMAEEDEDFGDYFEEEEDESQPEAIKPITTPTKSIDIEEMHGVSDELQVSQPTQQANFKFEVITESEVVAMLKGKVVELQSKFEFSNIDRGVFWTTLRQNSYLVKLCAGKLEDKVFDLMEKRECKELDPKKKYECQILGEEIAFHETAHLGCGHTVSKDCMRQYIEEEIKSKGKNAINSTCPSDGCPFLVTEDTVQKYCTPQTYKKYQTFLIADFVENYPCLAHCASPSCNLFFAVTENNLDSKRKLPLQDCSCKCAVLTCLSCKSAGHQPLSCHMILNWRQEVDGSVDKLNIEWKKNNTKRCPKCKVDIFKNTGCMHMICFNCKHDFCWLCLRDRAAHGGAHIASCSNPPAEDAGSAKTPLDKDLARLQYCMNRFLDHEQSMKILLSKFQEILKIVEGENTAFPLVNKFLLRFPGSLDFYVDSFRELIAARSFVIHTFPLQYMIKNQQEILLFLETQNLFMIALENQTGLLEKNNIESFVIEVNGVGCPSEDFEQRKLEILTLRNGLAKHNANLKRALSDETYMKKLQEEKNIDMTGMIKTGKVLEAKKTPDKGEIWLCFFCQKANKDSSFCKQCNRNTYSESYGYWVCAFCSNPSQRISEVCSNPYCKKGTRPKEAAGSWSCTLCNFPNTGNLTDKCRACNQRGK